MTQAPHFGYQDVSGNIYFELQVWSRESQLGQAVLAPGVIFTDADAVIPDVRWMSYDRLAVLMDEAGHFIVRWS